MRSTTLLLTLLTATTLATPSPPKKRQGNLSELLGLASYIGITALPTNPTALLQLGAAAAPLESALPTSPVLSVLETAAPKSFIGEILSNPSFASSFEAAFAAGSSPSWFNALPTDVKSYLHTYEGFPSLAAGAAALNSGLASVSAEATTGGGSTGGTSAGTTGGSVGGSAMSMTTTMVSTTSEGAVGTPTGGSSTSGAGSAGQSSAAAAASTSTTKTGGGSRLDGGVAAGLAGVVGVLAVALAL